MPHHILDDEARYRPLVLLDDSPELPQREPARALISPGKVSYCVRVDRGWANIESVGSAC